MCSGDGNWTLLQLGFPIRTSPDHSSVVNFPGLIADSYVLHRLLMPRHPPCALSSLSLTLNKNIATKMLASTMQFSRYGRYSSQRHRVPDRPGGSITNQQPAGPFDGRESPEGCSLSRLRWLDPSGPNSAPGVVLTSMTRSTPAEAGSTEISSRSRHQIVDVPLVSCGASRHSLEKRPLDPGPKTAA